METGIFLMELDCHSMDITYMRLVDLNQLGYVIDTVVTHHLAYIAVIFQLMPFIMIMTSLGETQSMLDCMLLDPEVIPFCTFIVTVARSEWTQYKIYISYTLMFRRCCNIW